MLFLQLFRTLYGKVITVILKGGQIIKGTLQSADQFYNFKLINIEVIEDGGCPEIRALKTSYIRGSSVIEIEINKDDVDLDLLHDATRAQTN